MHSRVISAVPEGIDAHLVEVEVHLGYGLPKYFLVGLPDRSVSEARDRIEAALKSSGLDVPRGRITVNLAPADLRKEGTAFDLPIAVNLLRVSGQVPERSLDHVLILGELGLDGALRPVPGILQMVSHAHAQGVRNVLVPAPNAEEACMVDGVEVYGFQSLRQVVSWLHHPDLFEPRAGGLQQQSTGHFSIDMAEVQGQREVKRALEVAAAGLHHIALLGAPGAGKTMMARRLATILPPLSPQERLEVVRIHSMAGTLDDSGALQGVRPFRSPHHTSSAVALVGGGTGALPGEVSLAHHGILFLDEFPEFSRMAVEAMRQPLEDGFVSISRLRSRVVYPCRLMLVASMNLSEQQGGVLDEPDLPRRRSYLSRISGPIWDRIDLQVPVRRPSFEEITGQGSGESSEKIRERVARAHAFAAARTRSEYLPGSAVPCPEGVQMVTEPVRLHHELTKGAMRSLRDVMQCKGMSARAYNQLIKVSRTIADLAESQQIQEEHMEEAVRYRVLDVTRQGAPLAKPLKGDPATRPA